jgi:HlyD family secretion protein
MEREVFSSQRGRPRDDRGGDEGTDRAPHHGNQTSAVVATVVSYATMIDVANPDEKLRPRMTATVTPEGSRRNDVVSIPNAALSFRPPSEVLDATAQTADVPAMVDVDALDRSAVRRVWLFDGRQFTGLTMRTGLTDDRWTERLAGAIEPGQLLVTSATADR